MRTVLRVLTHSAPAWLCTQQFEADPNFMKKVWEEQAREREEEVIQPQGEDEEVVPAHIDAVPSAPQVCAAVSHTTVVRRWGAPVPRHVHSAYCSSFGAPSHQLNANGPDTIVHSCSCGAACLFLPGGLAWAVCSAWQRLASR